MTLRKKLSDRKGAGMELALLVIITVLTLSVLILTTSMLQHSKHRYAEEQLEHIVALEQIGEDFCAKQGETDEALKNWFETRYPAYDFTVADGTLAVCKADTEEVLLTVQIADNTITQWNKK